MQAIHHRDEAAFTGAAARQVSLRIKSRARRYARNPSALDSVCSGLFQASSEVLIAVSRRVIERERRVTQRWIGFGGEVPLINARAAELLGRLLRRRAGKTREAETPR